jgi:hypothetical protein
MYRVLFIWLFLATTAWGSVLDGSIWINELHYDNEGADLGEFVEVAAPVSLTDVSNVTLTLYNGSSGDAYSGPTSLLDFTLGDTVDGYVFYTLDVSLQNGSPDGLALARGDQVLQFLSYEGVFTASDGVAAGLLSTSLGVEETTSTPVGQSLQLGGRGTSYSDFTWQSPLANTMGTINHNQQVVPEPASMILWLLALAAPLVLRGGQRLRRGAHSSVVD